MKPGILITVPAAFVVALALGSCGKDAGIPVTVKVGSLPSMAAREAFAVRAAPADAPVSSTEFGFAKVDGIRLNLTRLQAIDSSKEHDAITWSPAKQITIAPGTSNTLPITETAKIPVGSYRGVKIRYENAYSVKAYCVTKNGLVYTSTSGVKVVNPTPGTMPGDYDFVSYPFAEVTTATSATGPNPETMAETSQAFTIAATSTPRIAALFDPSYLVSCYDGTLASITGSNNALSPFIWTNNAGIAQTAFFPPAKPNFGMGYVPIFVWLSTDENEAPPSAETYASSLTQSDVNGASINFRTVDVTTMAFKADGSLLDARTRIGSSGSSTPLQQFFTGAVLASGKHSFYNGEWYCDAGYANCRVLKDRQVTDFARTTDLVSVATATYANGPDCGQTLLDPNHPEWGNRVRACLGASQSLFFRKVPR